MRRVAEGLQTGEEETSVVNYPVGIETAHMGISPTSESRSNRRRRPRPPQTHQLTFVRVGS
jgi:hypothetical protein